MHIKQLSIDGFRNLARQSLVFSEGLNWIHGPNGQGKTNLLEALHYLCIGKSQRGTHEGELIGFKNGCFHLAAQGTRKQAPLDLSVMVARQEKKKLLLNGRSLQRVSDLIGALNVVSFSPDDILMVRGEPGRRRVFIDVLLSQVHSLYLKLLQEYRRCLNERNFLLKRPGPIDRRLLSTYTDELIVLGVDIVRERCLLMDDLSQKAALLFGRLTELFGRLELSYQRSFEQNEQEALMESLARAFKKTEEQERVFRSTLVGPHREDFTIQLDGISLRRFGSQGQCRAAAAAIKLAAVEYISQISGERPILLLDDIFSELDATLSGNLRHMVSSGSQVFLAAPEFSGMEGAGQVFFVSGGMVAATVPQGA
jgi:DNA replication and repair protein RecF